MWLYWLHGFVNRTNVFNSHNWPNQKVSHSALGKKVTVWVSGPGLILHRGWLFLSFSSVAAHDMSCLEALDSRMCTFWVGRIVERSLSWHFYVHVTAHRNKFFLIKPTEAPIFPNLFLSRNSTSFGQFLCPSSGVLHCIFGTGICHAGLMTAFKQDQVAWGGVVVKVLRY